MPDPLANKHVVLGVSGSIACHKAVDLSSKLTQQGALVDVAMTKGATMFVTPLAFRAITHRAVLLEVFDPQTEMGIDHVAAAERADVVVVAPATANTIAKLALGLADDAVSTTVLATQAPVIVCPAMDGHMYDNPATQENLLRLESRGVMVAGPASGPLASGLTGTGRLLETEEILGHIRLVLGRHGDLKGKKVVVSAGGTREAIDPVRFIGNRSSGKMGYALAEAARDRGATTVLVSGPSALSDPVGAIVTRVETTSEMQDAVASESNDADVLIMAAAVADWRPAAAATHKLKKGNAQRLTIDLERTPDIVAGVRRDGLIKVGFAAESENLEDNARLKLREKGLDLIAANDITAPDSGFATDTNRVVLLDKNGDVERLGLMSKYKVAHRIMDRVAGSFGKE